MRNVKHQYIKSGLVEFFVEVRGMKVILLTAKFNDFNDIRRLRDIAILALDDMNIERLVA